MQYTKLGRTGMYREEVREMRPLCADPGHRRHPGSPQARGRLTGDWDYKGIRAETEEADKRVVTRVTQIRS